MVFYDGITITGWAMVIHTGSSCQNIGESYWNSSITNEDKFSLLAIYSKMDSVHTELLQIQVMVHWITLEGS